MAWPDGYGPRRKVKDGVRATTARGKFGSTWWGRRFVETMEGLAEDGRLARGRTYARDGQVISLAVLPGRIEGDVQGSQVEPFSATVTVATLDPFDTDEVVETVRRSPGMLTTLASGALPQELGRWLLPSSASDLRYDCSCPDHGSPCKHAAALTYLTAERIDADPTRLLVLRGLSVDALVGDTEDDGVSLVDPADHFGDATVLPALPEVPFVAAPDDLEDGHLLTALRTAEVGGAAVGEAAVRAGAEELRGLYRRLGGFR